MTVHEFKFNFKKMVYSRAENGLVLSICVKQEGEQSVNHAINNTFINLKMVPIFKIWKITFIWT